MEFGQILHTDVYWEELGWDFYMSVFKIHNRVMTLD